MRDGIRWGLGTLAMVACAAAVTCCSGEAGDGSGDGTTDPIPAAPPVADPAPPSPPPPSVPSFPLDGGGTDAGPPAPAARTMWAIDDATSRLVRFTAEEPG